MSENKERGLVGGVYIHPLIARSEKVGPKAKLILGCIFGGDTISKLIVDIEREVDWAAISQAIAMGEGDIFDCLMTAALSGAIMVSRCGMKTTVALYPGRL